MTVHDGYINRIGGSFSKFHIMAFIGLMICNATNGYFVYHLVFLLLFPKYHCIDEFGIESPCKRLQTCQSFSYTEEPILSNWVQQFDLRCKSNFTIGLFGSMFFVGKVVGMITLSHLGDSIGRINLLKFSQSVTLVCYFSMTFLIKDSKFLVIPIFIAGLLSCWRTNLAYIYAQEMFTTKTKNLAGTIMLVNDVFTLLYATLFYSNVSTEWTYLFYIILTLITLSIVILFKMPESPSFLLENFKYFEAQDAYNHIAKFNGKRTIEVDIPADRSIIEEDGTITILSIESSPDL